MDLLYSDSKKILTTLRRSFQSGKTLPKEFRKDQLTQLGKLLEENKRVLLKLIQKDLGRPYFEAKSVFVAVQAEVAITLMNLSKWMSPTYNPRNLLVIRDQSFIYPEPFGVVLILSAWNAPLALSLHPLIGAIAAGNCAVIKPSEYAPSVSAELKRLVGKYLDPECFQVIEGGPEIGETLLKLEKFDYIFFTGSQNVGRKVAIAAAEKLTPVTLELGGKCPVYIHSSANLWISLKRILFAKISAAGHACIAPDSILCSKSVQEYILENTSALLKTWFGEDVTSSSDYCRVLNKQHFHRLKNLVLKTNGKVHQFGKENEENLRFPLTIVTELDEEDELLNEEVFGPILLIINAENEMKALNFLQRRESSPLTIYLFAEDEKVKDLFLKRTQSGCLSINEALLHCYWPKIPFGGVGGSGVGAYHGIHSFLTFSHQKGVLKRNTSLLTELGCYLRYPPHYNETFANFVTEAMRRILEYWELLELPSFAFISRNILGMAILFGAFSVIYGILI